MAKITPMMQQYFEIKEQYKHCLLFFRLGDFYEMFFEDAVIASKELEITLTGKDWGQEERAPMCGVPFHSADGYIARLVERGYKVAICEQWRTQRRQRAWSSAMLCVSLLRGRLWITLFWMKQKITIFSPFSAVQTAMALRSAM